LWWVFFKIGSRELFAQGWLWTTILLIPAFWVARITGVSHQCLAWSLFFWLILYLHLYLCISRGPQLVGTLYRD
jgi:hypothetical protein